MSTSKDTPIENKDSLLKEAADALELAKLRTDAEKLAFSMVERGKVPPFESFVEFEEKVAGLMQKDLRVVAEALELDVTLPEFGKIASESDVPADAHAAFFHRLAED